VPRPSISSSTRTDNCSTFHHSGRTWPAISDPFLWTRYRPLGAPVRCTAVSLCRHNWTHLPGTFHLLRFPSVALLPARLGQSLLRHLDFLHPSPHVGPSRLSGPRPHALYSRRSVVPLMSLRRIRVRCLVAALYLLVHGRHSAAQRPDLVPQTTWVALTHVGST
jgi:hypothetical protein